MVRPRGWHLLEKHLPSTAGLCSGSLWDFGLFFFHNAKKLVAKGTGPYFYLPKLESYLEARLWNDVFVTAQKHRGLPKGTIRATVLIETILATFQMDEILWELRDHSAGLNCGRWDYIFSVIKKFAATRIHPSGPRPGHHGQGFPEGPTSPAHPDLPSPEHPRDGGDGRADPDQERPGGEPGIAGEGRADKWREVKAGHDGTWVAHPGLVPVAKRIFDEGMPQANQISTGSARR